MEHDSKHAVESGGDSQVYGWMLVPQNESNHAAQQSPGASSVKQDARSAWHEEQNEFLAVDGNCQCVVHGRHVDNEHLANGSEIIVFFGSARPGLGHHPGQLWVCDDAHIAYLGIGVVQSSGRIFMDLKAGQ